MGRCSLTGRKTLPESWRQLAGYAQAWIQTWILGYLDKELGQSVREKNHRAAAERAANVASSPQSTPYINGTRLAETISRRINPTFFFTPPLPTPQKAAADRSKGCWSHKSHRCQHSSQHRKFSVTVRAEEVALVRMRIPRVDSFSFPWQKMTSRSIQRILEMQIASDRSGWSCISTISHYSCLLSTPSLVLVHASLFAEPACDRYRH